MASAATTLPAARSNSLDNARAGAACCAGGGAAAGRCRAAGGCTREPEEA